MKLYVVLLIFLNWQRLYELPWTKHIFVVEKTRVSEPSCACLKTGHAAGAPRGKAFQETIARQARAVEPALCRSQHGNQATEEFVCKYWKGGV